MACSAYRDAIESVASGHLTALIPGIDDEGDQAVWRSRSALAVMTEEQLEAVLSPNQWTRACALVGYVVGSREFARECGFLPAEK